MKYLALVVLMFGCSSPSHVDKDMLTCIKETEKLNALNAKQHCKCTVSYLNTGQYYKYAICEKMTIPDYRQSKR